MRLVEVRHVRNSFHEEPVAEGGEELVISGIVVGSSNAKSLYTLLVNSLS
jgi:hypothetical protein